MSSLIGTQQLSFQEKLEYLKAKRTKIQLGSLDFASPLLLAPMSSICNAPFRLVMEKLGAGGTVSELISSHGLEYKNKRTLRMLFVHPEEKHMGIQLFGEDALSLNEAAQIAQDFNPKFIDLNLGCPVKKVVTKGAGSALLQEPKKLEKFFKLVNKDLKIPLTVKIRTGWDTLNADESLKAALNAGAHFVAVHGRTRSQQYTGHANWDYLESLGKMNILPLIGNGDLYTPEIVKARWQKTSCQALMIGRGALRNPFIFLESYYESEDEKNIYGFSKSDYYTVTLMLYEYMKDYYSDERILLVQLRKHLLWFAAGFPHAASYRSKTFDFQKVDDLLKLSADFFLTDGLRKKQLNLQEQFMTSGHG